MKTVVTAHTIAIGPTVWSYYCFIFVRQVVGGGPEVTLLKSQKVGDSQKPEQLSCFSKKC
jgi:hypothetical protein